MDQDVVQLAAQAKRAAESSGVTPKPREDVEVGVSDFLPFATPYQNAWEVMRSDGSGDEVTISQLVAMRKTDGQARALYRLMTLPIRAALKTATFVPGPNVTGGDEEAQFAEQLLNLPEIAGGMTVPFPRFIAQMLMAVFDGFAGFEFVYHVPQAGPLKGKWTIKKLSYRPSNTITFLLDDKADFAGFRQRTVHLGKTVDVKIPAQHAVYYAVNEEERPFYGQSFFQSAFYHYDKKVRLYFVAHLAAQRAAVGTRVGKMPASPTKDERREFVKALADLGVAQYIAVPDGYAVESLKEGGTFDFLSFINHHNSQMSKSILASFFDKDQGGGGGDAKLVDFGQQSDALFILMLETIMGEIEAVINNKIIPRFIDWNFGSGKYPIFKFGQLTQDQKQMVIDTFSTLAVVAQTGLSCTPEFVHELEKKVADEFGLEIDYEAVEEEMEAKKELERQQTAAMFGIPDADPNGDPQAPQPGAPPGAPSPTGSLPGSLGGGPAGPTPPGGPARAPSGAVGGPQPLSQDQVTQNMVPPGFELSGRDAEVVVPVEDLARDLLLQAANRLMGDDVPVELAGGTRKVRTAEGSRMYGQPIGTVITKDMVTKAERMFGRAAVSAEHTEPKPKEPLSPDRDSTKPQGPIASVSTHPEMPGARLLEFQDGSIQVQHPNGDLSPRQKWDLQEFRQYGWSLGHQAEVPGTPGYRDPVQEKAVDAALKQGLPIPKSVEPGTAPTFNPAKAPAGAQKPAAQAAPKSSSAQPTAKAAPATQPGLTEGNRPGKTAPVTPQSAPPKATAEPYRLKPVSEGPLTDKEYAAHVHEIETRVAKAIKEGKVTAELYRDEYGTYTPERAKLQDEVIEALWSKYENVPSEGKAIMAGGLGGAGKTTVLTKHANVDLSQYVMINPDDVKEEMAKRGMVPEVEGLSPLELAPLIHIESSDLSVRMAERAIREGRNIIFDMTMAWQPQVEKRLGWLEEGGYQDIQAIFVDIPVETSVARILSRHRKGLERHRNGQGDGGRYVPPAITREQAHPSETSLNKVNFENVKNRFDSWKLYDNNGSAPTETDRRDGARKRRKFGDGTKSTASAPKTAERWRPKTSAPLDVAQLAARMVKPRSGS